MLLPYDPEAVSTDERGARSLQRRSRNRRYILAAVALSFLLGVLLIIQVTSSETNPCSLIEAAVIPLPHAVGRIDHMAFNPLTKLLVIAARNNNSLAIVNTSSMLLVKTLNRFSLPQWAAFVNRDHVVVTNGGNGTVSVLNSSDFSTLTSIHFSADADNLAVDSTTSMLYVGYGTGGVAMINTTDWKVTEQIPLLGHPEAMRVEENGSRLFVNVPAGDYIAVLNKTNGNLIANWPVANATGVYPMALDEGHHILFVASRQPSRLISINATSGAQIAEATIPGDADDVFFDSNNGCVYVSSGEGAITVLKEVNGKAPTLEESIQTYPGARTSFLSASVGLYFIAVPQSENSSAMAVVYHIRGG